MGQAEKSPMVKIFSERLVSASQGVSQASLSKMLGIGQSNVSMYLRGDCIPSLDVFRSLCIALGVKSDYLLGLPGGDDIAISPSDSACKSRALDAERKLAKVNEALGKVIEGTKALQEAVK